MNIRKVSKILIVMILVISIVACGKVQSLKSESIINSPDTHAYSDAIYQLQESILATNELYSKSILLSNTLLSSESIKSLQGLIEFKTKETTDKYSKLSLLDGNKQDEVTALKNALNKLQSMNSDLNKYQDTFDNRKKLTEDWKIVTTYWKTYYEMSKVESGK